MDRKTKEALERWIRTQEFIRQNNEEINAELAKSAKGATMAFMVLAVVFLSFLVFLIIKGG